MKKILELLRSGDFTISYHDNGYCSLSKGHHKYSDEVDTIKDFDNNETEGYVPSVVALLVKALGGKSNSI